MVRIAVYKNNKLYNMVKKGIIVELKNSYMIQKYSNRFGLMKEHEFEMKNVIKIYDDIITVDGNDEKIKKIYIK